MKWRAALPMYDFPPLTVAHQAFWTAVVTHLHRQGFAHLPAQLETVKRLNLYWKHPQVLFTQCCEFPFLKTYYAHLQLLASPIYDCDGCKGAQYSSVVVSRAGDARRKLSDYYQARVAINELTSNSGYNLLGATIATLGARNPFFKSHLISGSHAASLAAVREDRADVASIDCVSFAQLSRAHLIDPRDYHILTRSPMAGTLPWVCAKNVPTELRQALIAALKAALIDPHLAHTRQALLLKDADFNPDVNLTLTKQALAQAMTVRLTEKV